MRFGDNLSSVSIKGLAAFGTGNARCHGREGLHLLPVDEPPHLQLKAEIEAANPFAVRCTATGSATWQGQSIARRTSSHLYISNPRAGSPGARRSTERPESILPAQPTAQRDHGVGQHSAIRAKGRRGDTADRTTQEVYHYETGKLVGHVEPRGRFVPLSDDPRGGSCTIEGGRWVDPGRMTIHRFSMLAPRRLVFT